MIKFIKRIIRAFYQPIIVGRTYKFLGDYYNPFHREFTVKVLNVKNGHVEYEIGTNPITYISSLTIFFFNMLYVVKEESGKDD